ncbi:hypothetical protein NE584_05705 [Clostridium sp. DFI.5.61]|uniref:hypothetical protein n=1 Tax=Clostridium sp. DFI.5.61 TaxID=2965279 RepID=UPI00210E99B8|nr:hypothetical protein [Clostridium sp. DFI.5.61]MCQ5158527.1 hypothetical protein [Clostridium sp. DFI.5.61]
MAEATQKMLAVGERNPALSDVITEMQPGSGYDRAIKKQEGGSEYVRYQYRSEQHPE